MLLQDGRNSHLLQEVTGRWPQLLHGFGEGPPTAHNVPPSTPLLDRGHTQEARILLAGPPLSHHLTLSLGGLL